MLGIASWVKRMRIHTVEKDFKEINVCRMQKLNGYPQQRLKISLAGKVTRKRIQKEEQVDVLFGCDDQFSFIAGYTESGVSFGVAWEEK